MPVVNASFEGGVAKGLPAGWSRYGGLRKTTDVFLVPGRDGTVLRLEDRDPAAEIGITQIVPWPGGTTVQAICQTAGMPGSPRGGAFLQIRFSPSGKYLQRTLVTTENGAYSRTVVEGEVPPGTKVCQLFLYTHAAPKPHVLVDDLKLMADVVLAKKTKRAKGVKKMAKPKPPVYAKLKPLHLTTPLAQAVIAVPKAPAHGKLAERIQTAIHAQCGRTIPIVSDTEVKTPLETHVIAVGNRSTNDLTSRLYDRYYSLLDLKYPGVGGHVVRTVHNPFGTAFNAVTLGGSDDAGVAAAVEAFLAILTKLPPGDEQASIGRIVEIQLGKGMKIPKNPSDAKIWEESRTYGSSGYFGWCVISKCMALYHMTGEERFAREFLRLAFPDEKAIADLEKLDGERIENKHEPLAGPYHYSAHMMILFWDLIEESPFFDDETRLRVTNAFSKQLEHRLREHVYGVTSPPASVGNRHGDWSAMALYTLARYFQKDYPGPVWEGGLESCRIYFSALLRSAWLAGRNDHIFWYTSYYDPMLDYMYLSGDFSGWEKGFLKQALVTQDVLFNGSRNDWGLKASSLNFLLRAADLTGDARWLFYRDRTEIDTNGLRLGQSFWPAPDVQPRPPTELLDRWTIQPMPEPFWKTRASGFTLDESFLWGSYRNSLDDSGDLILIKGANGGGRNPYHTFSLLEFRLDGVTLLKGYGTQVLTTADGLVEPKVAMDGALKSCSAIGDTAWAVGEVPEMPFCNWRRHILRRKKSFCVIVDELTFETDSENMTRQTIWDTVGGTWDAAGNTLRLAGAQNESTLPGWKTIRALDVVCRSKPSNDDGPRNMIDLNSVGIRMVKARDPGDFIEMEFVADQPMEGELFAKLMDHSDRGGVRILLDGKVVVPAYTHFSASTQTSRVPLGRHTLQPGTHRLRVEAVSRHEGLDRCYIGLAGLAMKGDQAKMELKPTSAYELHPSDAVSATGRGKITMTWNGEVKAGEKRAYFYLVARGGGEVLACRRISPTAA
ncbi:MAG: hypothetical protein KAI66_05950, partial [Lentisphaeria bacterium]|nr:hypothetical protein [Lentisphaeria bacterium]